MSRGVRRSRRLLLGALALLLVAGVAAHPAQAGRRAGGPRSARAFDPAAARRVAKREALRLGKAAAALSSLGGSGFERYGLGDADVIRRRQIVLRLVEQNVFPIEQLLSGGARGRGRKALPGWVQRDLAALNLVERVDTMRDPGQATGFATLDELWQRVAAAQKKNDARAKTTLRGLRNGTRSFFELDHVRCSTAVLGRIDDPELRARTMVDMLLQLRDPEDRHRSFAELRVAGTEVQGIMELRQNAARTRAKRGDAAAEREYALMRALTTSHPRMSSNAILEARNLMGELRRMSWQLVYGDQATQRGSRLSPYEAIHRNFNTQTQKVIRSFVGDVVFGGGRPETFVSLVDAMNAARSGRPAEGRRILDEALKQDAEVAKALRAFDGRRAGAGDLGARLEGFLVTRCKGKLDSVDFHNASAQLVGDQAMHLEKTGAQAIRGQYAKKLTLVRDVYRAVCHTMPTAETLGDQLFAAKGAYLPVANVISKLRQHADRSTTCKAIAIARARLRNEVAHHDKGYQRIGIWQVDRQLEALHAKLLGDAVVSIGKCRTQTQQLEALDALSSALVGAMASGLDQLRDVNRPGQGPTLKQALAAVSRLRPSFARGKASPEQYRKVMLQADEAIAQTTGAIQRYFEARIPHVEQGKLLPDREFFENFVKEGPLHYAAAITQQATRVGLRSELSSKRAVNPEGVAVLNPVGRVIFDRLVVASSLGDLSRRGATRSDFGILLSSGAKQEDEKKMVAVGGVLGNFPGGYSHAVNFARGAGMAALSCDKIGRDWQRFAAHVGGDKLYYDDRGGQVVLMPLREALQRGLVRTDEVQRLRPGSNNIVREHRWSESREHWKVASETAHIVNPERPTNVIDIYAQARRVRGVGKSVLSFDEIGKLGTDARGLVGEKALVLGLATTNRRLRDLTPAGTTITGVGVRRALQSAGVLKPWLALLEDKRFTSDPSWRERERRQMELKVERALRERWIGRDGKPTRAGKALLRAVYTSDPRLRQASSLILRSAFTAEDRPYKSSAGQHDSFPNKRGDQQVLEGIIGVIRSAWNRTAVENAVSEGFDLRLSWPTVIVMECIDAKKSGVFLTRDARTGFRRTLSYQALPGFGGGVEHGRTEEGRITRRSGRELLKPLPGSKRPVVGKQLASQLYSAGMELEQLFHRVVEPGLGLPLDVEWAVDGAGKLKIVQARTVPMR